MFDDHQEQYDTTDPANNNAREKLESQVRPRATATAALLGARARGRLVMLAAEHPPQLRDASVPLLQLKDQIKKLQRLRDSIKTWCARRVLRFCLPGWRCIGPSTPPSLSLPQPACLASPACFPALFNACVQLQDDQQRHQGQDRHHQRPQGD